MHVSRMIPVVRRSSLAAACAVAAFAALSGEAMADSAYVAQVPNQLVRDVAMTPAKHAGQPANWRSSPNHAGAMQAPEAITATHQNLARSYQIGSYNSAFHLQAGADNSSTVGIIGVQNNVAVLQSGNNLRSNVVLLGTSGLNIGVLQPKGSAPVNLLVARLPGGGLLIKR